MCLSVSELQASLGGILDSSKAVSELSGLIDWECMSATFLSGVGGYGSLLILNFETSQF